MNNARQAERLNTALDARILAGDGAPPMACVIKDLSDSGAKLEVSGAYVVPQSFELEITSGGQVFRVRTEVKWRYSHLIGVRFADTTSNPSKDQVMRDALIVENARLWDALETFAKRLTQLGEPVVLPADLLLTSPSRDALMGRRSA